MLSIAEGNRQNGRGFCAKFMAAATVCLIAVVATIWYPALDAQLVGDDFRLVGTLGFSDALRYFHETFGFGRNEYRPVTALSYALDRWFWDGRAAGYHLTNLLLHAGVSLLLFVLLHALTRDVALAVLAALLFSVHPVTHERVAWICARDGLVSGVFMLGALWCYVLFRQRGDSWLCIAALFAAGLAMLAYEGAVVLPLIVLAVELLFFSRARVPARLLAALRVTAPFSALGILYVCLWQAVFEGSIGAYSLAGGAGEAARNYGRLLYTLFFGHRRVAFGAAYAVIVIAGLARLHAWRTTAAFGAAVVALGFIPFAVMNGFAHRFAYVSATGFAVLMAGCILWAVRSSGRIGRATVLTMAFVICSYHVVQVRRILSEWVTAGEIASRILRLVRQARPVLPNGAVVLIRGAPKMHGRAMVFPKGLEAAIQRQYRNPIYVATTADFDAPATQSDRASGAPVYYFECSADGYIREVRPRR